MKHEDIKKSAGKLKKGFSFYMIFVSVFALSVLLFLNFFILPKFSGVIQEASPDKAESMEHRAGVIMFVSFVVIPLLCFASTRDLKAGQFLILEVLLTIAIGLFTALYALNLFLALYSSAGL